MFVNRVIEKSVLYTRDLRPLAKVTLVTQENAYSICS